MDGVLLFLIAAGGTAVWVCNPETAAVVFSADRGWSPFLVGAVCAAGQAAAQVVLWKSGAQLRRWRFFDRLCARAESRHGERLRRHVVLVAAGSGLLSLPPLVASATLAGPLRLPVKVLIPLITVFRFVRFTLIAAFGRVALVGAGLHL